jgi:branched-chain amino acid transport system permease protein
MIYLLQQVLNAVPLAALYAALAFGYSLVFGMTRRVDITYGALFAFAGQMFVLFADTGWSRYYLVLPAALGMGALAAFIYTIGSGWLIGRHIMRPLYQGSANAVIVASLAVLIILSETARLASNAQEIWLSPFLNQRVVVMAGADVSLTILQIVNATLMILMVAVGAAVMHFSRLGRLWRAVAQDSQAARFCGVNADLVFLCSFVVAAAVAAVCGVLATSYYGTMGFGAGMVFGVKVALIAAVGGQSHPLRSALGATIVALAETLWSGYGSILWKDFVVTGSLVLLLVSTRRESLIP